ncbi:metallophosphoesterase family protein [Lentzea nigeriaca]|uniref:hypothetical protein n=1 Tax=Lentzea nigeriaca TaxID=1128665 RepID=UPI00195B2582|nr:hypothetical protein [Lentzea nigeriaca]MBM7863145.1 hypothetical protein [Lentzea nigeriaca]
MAVTVGVTDDLIATFDQDAPQWTFGSARATGSASPEPNGHTGTHSSTGTIRGGRFDQMEMLRKTLQTAEGQAIMMMHHPPRDPTPACTSQLPNHMEAAYFEKLLSERDKPTAFIGGHVGDFFASTVDGIPYVVNGNSGKAQVEQEASPAGPSSALPAAV